MKRNAIFRPGIGGKLFLSFLSMALLVAALSIASGRQTAALEQNLKRLMEELIPVLTDLEALSRSVTELSGQALNPRNHGPVEAAEGRIFDHQQSVIIAADGMLNGTVSTLDLLLVERYRNRWERAKQRVENVRRIAFRLINREVAASNVSEVEKLEDAHDEAISALQEIRLIAIKELNESHAEADIIQRRSIWTHWMALLLSLAAAFVLSVVFTNQFITPIMALVEATRNISSGSLGVRVEISGQDELTQLGQSFNEMAERLQKTTVSKDSVDSILSAMTEALCVVDREGFVRQTNRAWQRSFGGDSNCSLGKKLDEIWPQLAAFVREIAEGPGIFDQDARKELPRDDAGERRSFVASLKRMSQVPGVDEPTLVVVQDVTEARRAEADLRAFREKMLHAEQLASLGSVAAILSHKLNQPLTVLRLLVQQMLRNLDSKEVLQKKLETALEEIDVVRAQIREVLQYSRPIDSEQRKFVDLKALLAKAAELFVRSFEEHEIHFEVKDVQQHLGIEGNEDQLAEAFYILIENAMHACQGRTGCRITAGTLEREGAVVVYVSDTGSGIPAAVLGRVFEPFFTTKSADKGTGLGLARLKQIVTAHDGETWIESECGSGTTVFFSLPTGKRADAWNSM